MGLIGLLRPNVFIIEKTLFVSNLRGFLAFQMFCFLINC